jgi:hypothetical protein
MKLIIKILIIIMLLFNGIGAFYGGLSLITDPGGQKLQLPASYLKNIPFENYLIPGIVLIIVNGLLSFVILIMIIVNHRKTPYMVMLQGILLSGWIIIQIFMVKDFYPPLHGTLLTIGILLTLGGIYMRKKYLRSRFK